MYLEGIWHGIGWYFSWVLFWGSCSLLFFERFVEFFHEGGVSCSLLGVGLVQR